MTATVRGSYGRRHGHNSTPSPLEPAKPGLVAAMDLCRLADITYRQIDYWCLTYDIPIAIPAEGSGSNRWFDAGDVPKFHTVGRLAATGMRPSILWRLSHQQRLRLAGHLRKALRTAGAE